MQKLAVARQNAEKATITHFGEIFAAEAKNLWQGLSTTTKSVTCTAGSLLAFSSAVYE